MARRQVRGRGPQQCQPQASFGSWPGSALITLLFQNSKIPLNFTNSFEKQVPNFMNSFEKSVEIMHRDGDEAMLADKYDELYVKEEN